MKNMGGYYLAKNYLPDESSPGSSLYSLFLLLFMAAARLIVRPSRHRLVPVAAAAAERETKEVRLASCHQIESKERRQKKRKKRKKKKGGRLENQVGQLQQTSSREIKPQLKKQQ